MSDQRQRHRGVAKSFAASRLLALAAHVVSLLLLALQAYAQPVTIPLQYYPNVNYLSLGITVGINGGAPQPYLFDTGSNLFNAAFNPATWQGFGQTPPAATVPNGTNILYCYASPPCYRGNLVQVPALNFYAAGATAGSTPAATLSVSPGYQISAVNAETKADGTVLTAYPQTISGPMLYNTFYGIFGAATSPGYRGRAPPTWAACWARRPFRACCTRDTSCRPTASPIP